MPAVGEWGNDMKCFSLLHRYNDSVLRLDDELFLAAHYFCGVNLIYTRFWLVDCLLAVDFFFSSILLISVMVEQWVVVDV